MLTAIADRALEVLGNLVEILQQTVQAHLGKVLGVRVCAQGCQRRVDRLEVRHVVTLLSSEEGTARQEREKLKSCCRSGMQGSADGKHGRQEWESAPTMW